MHPHIYLMHFVATACPAAETSGSVIMWAGLIQTISTTVTDGSVLVPCDHVWDLAVPLSDLVM